MSYLVAGGLRVDYIITADDQVRIREMGGNALYAAGGVRLWLDDVMLLAKVGDNYPQEWLNRLSGWGLGIDGIHRVPGSHEQRTFYAYIDPNTRVDHDPAFHFARVGHPLPPELDTYDDSLVGQRQQHKYPLMLRATDIPGEAHSFEAAHISPMGIYTQVDLAAGLKRRGVAQVTLDPGEYTSSPTNLPLIRSICASVDAFLPSDQEVALLLGDVGPHEAAEEFASWGVSIVVIKRGEKGVLVYEADARRFTSVAPYPGRVVDVTGAGDTFCGGFAAGLHLHGDPRRAAVMGSVAASFAIEAYGAQHVLAIARPAVEQRLAAFAQAADK